MSAGERDDSGEPESEPDGTRGVDDKRAEGPADHAPRPDPDAPGNYVDDEEAPEVPEPNEPA